MKLCNIITILLAAFCFIVPVTIYAVEEEPSFTNPAQAQHAENIAEASFSEFDLADAQERAQKAYAEDMAESFIEEKAQEYADEVMKDAAEAAAKELVDTKIKDYAEATALEKTGLAEPPERGDDDYTAYEDAYLEAKLEAEKRAYGDFGEGRNNAYETAVESWLADPDNQQIGEDAKDDALKRAYGDFGPDRPNAYQSALQRFYGEDIPKEVFEEYLAEKVAEITGARLEEIHRLRYEEKKGWGQIKQMYPVPKGVLGRGHSYDIKLPKYQNTPPAPEELSLNDEIAEVTQRSKNNGWNKNQVSTTQKGKSKKWIGLTGTSAAAQTTVSETVGGNGKGNNGNSDASAGAGNSSKSKNSSASVSAGNNQSGKDKSNNGKSGKSSKSGSNGNGGKGGKGNNGNGNGKKN